MATAPAFAPVHETPLDAAALRDPIEYLKFEHFRQRVLCDLLGRIADDPYEADNRRRVAWVLGYLANELALHVADEEQDLLPLLGQRCNRGDALIDISGALEHEHGSDETLKADVIAGLATLATGRLLEKPLEFIVKAQMFEEHLRRHLVWENLTLMPLARRRLTPDDLVELGRNMARRHELGAPVH
jgi:hemerythrin-like domain-containing protein